MGCKCFDYCKSIFRGCFWQEDYFLLHQSWVNHIKIMFMDFLQSSHEWVRILCLAIKMRGARKWISIFRPLMDNWFLIVSNNSSYPWLCVPLLFIIIWMLNNSRGCYFSYLYCFIPSYSKQMKSQSEHGIKFYLRNKAKISPRFFIYW